MRASVKAAWPAMCKEYEGRLSTMYLDTRGLVTTGTGNLIDSVAAAQALPWLTKDGTPATAGQVAAEWKQIKARQSSKSLGGYAFVKWATLHIDDATIDRLLFEVTDKFWTRLAQALPKIETFPADAQLVLLDEAWQNGPAFLDPGTAWTGTRAAVLAQDWLAAASHVPGTGRRADRRKRLFTNAATAVNVGADPDALWDAKTPTAPVLSTPHPTPDPQEIPDVAKVKFRGGWTCSCVATSLPLVEQDMIRRGLIKNSIDLYQLGYRNDVAASAGTHDGGGNTDVAQFSDKQIDVWRLWGWTIQHRTKAQGFDMDHGHGWPLGCTHLSSGGRAQAAQWANRQNGLVSKGRVSGRWPIDTWKTAMKKRLAEIAKAEENELPTPKDVAAELAVNDKFLDAIASRVVGALFSADVIPNVFTGNPTNVNVTLPTALISIGKKASTIDAKSDALAASVAASFPKPTA